MPRIAKELSVKKVEQLARQLPNGSTAVHAVGGAPGLLLRVARRREKGKMISQVGGVSWVLRIQLAPGNRRDIALGSYRDLTLADAREKARSFRSAYALGRDPVAEQKQAIAEAKVAEANVVTFESAARDLYENKKVHELTNEKNRKQWLKQLEDYVFPEIGRRPIESITAYEVQGVLERKGRWREIPTTMDRIRSRMAEVFNYGFHQKRILGRVNPATWKGNLEHVLASPTALAKQNRLARGGAENHPALPYARAYRFLCDVKAAPGIDARALEFLIHTASRAGAVAKMQWLELNLEDQIWTVPAQRTKNGIKLIVPLSQGALDALPKKGRPDDYVWPGERAPHMHENALNNLVKLLHEQSASGYTDPKQNDLPVTAHGFRTTFKTWAQDKTQVRDEVSEFCLGHITGDAARKAYARGDMLEQRRELLEQWSEFCAKRTR